MDRRAFLKLAATGALAAALPRCGSPASRERRFRMNLRSEPPTLDPNLATDNVSLRVLTNLMEGLTAYGDGLRAVPAAAERWEVLEGGARVLFHLRRDGRWSDGVPVTAGNFEFSWKRFLDPETAAEYAYFLYDVEGAEAYNTGRLTDAASVGVRALDDRTLEVRLARPVVFFPMITTFMVLFPLRPDVIARYGDAWTEPGHFVGNGPFALEAWRHEYKVSLGRNPHYRNPPRIEGVDFFMVNEPTVELTLFERGDLDFALLPIVEIPRYEESPLFHRKPMLRAEYYGFNCKKTPFDDPRVRRAFSLAIDRAVFPRILHGGETPMASWIPPGMFAHEPGIGLHFDLDAARSALADAGFPGGKGFPRVDLAFNTGEEPRMVAENMQSQWKQGLGVTVRLRNVEWKAYLKEIATDPPGLWRLGWGADYPDPDNFMNLFTAASGNNHTRWGSDAYDRLVADAALVAEKPRRKAMYDEAQRMLCAEAAAIMPLYSRAHNFLVSPRVEGLWINEMDYLYLDRVNISGEAEA